MKKRVYLNYASTSYKKFPNTIKLLVEKLQGNAHINEGRNLAAIDDADTLLDARLAVKDYSQAPNARNVVFTQSVTMSLNMVLTGLLNDGDHVLCTSVEHNAVARPLELLRQTHGVEATYMPCQPDGQFDPNTIGKHVRPNTKMLVMTHASNVLGTILPVADCFEIAKEYGLLTVLDSAQTAGYLPISMREIDIDILTFTGHKGLMALSGIGGFVIGTDELAGQMRPLLVGGTGSESHMLEQPDIMPDKFEPGTHNTIGITSLLSAIEEMNKIGISNIRKHEEELFGHFLQGLKDLPLTIYGTRNPSKSVPTVSVNSPEIDPAILSQALFEEYGIITRSGLHCAPFAHRTAGTDGTGSLRFSLGYYTTLEELNYTIGALRALLCK